MFEVPGCARREGTESVGQAAYKARDHVVGKVADSYPFRLIDFNAIKPDMALVFAELPAVKHVKDLVAFRVVRRPVMNQEALYAPVQPKFFAQFTFAGFRRGLAAIDIATRNVPSVAVSLVDKQNPATINEQYSRRESRG